MDQATLGRIRATLEEERASVEHQLQEYGVPVGADEIHVDVDEGFADSGSATAERSQLLTMVEQLQHAHEDILLALNKIEQGTYGKCERCGNEIPAERLEAMPRARLCVPCKQATGS
jgi:DnaK suppressor protein